MQEKLEKVFEEARDMFEWLDTMHTEELLSVKNRDEVTRMVEQEIARRIIGLLKQAGG